MHCHATAPIVSGSRGLKSPCTAEYRYAPVGRKELADCSTLCVQRTLYVRTGGSGWCTHAAAGDTAAVSAHSIIISIIIISIIIAAFLHEQCSTPHNQCSLGFRYPTACMGLQPLWSMRHHITTTINIITISSNNYSNSKWANTC